MIRRGKAKGSAVFAALHTTAVFVCFQCKPNQEDCQAGHNITSIAACKQSTTEEHSKDANSLSSQPFKARQGKSRQSATRCLEGRTNLERQSAAFCGQGAEAHWSASLPSRQLSVQDILVQSRRIQLRAREVLVKKMAFDSTDVYIREKRVREVLRRRVEKKKGLVVGHKLHQKQLCDGVWGQNSCMLARNCAVPHCGLASFNTNKSSLQ